MELKIEILLKDKLLQTLHNWLYVLPLAEHKRIFISQSQFSSETFN